MGNSLLQRMRIAIAAIASLGVITACGGGGGGGGGGSTPPPQVSYLDISISAINGQNVEGARAKRGRFEATLTAEGQAQFSSTDTVYIIVTSTSQAIFSIDVGISGFTGTAFLNFDSSLPVGSYPGTLRIQLCKDSGCANQVSSDTLPVQYEVVPPPIPEDVPLELTFTRYQDTEPATLVQPLDFSQYAPLVEEPVVRLELGPEIGANSPLTTWVEMTYENDELTFTAPDMTLPCGTYEGELFIGYNTVAFEGDNTIPVQLSVSSLPVVESVQPKLGFSDRASEHTLVGCGFDAIAAADVTIPGLSPTAITIDSDTEISMSLPAGVTPGAYTVAIPSQMVADAPADQLVIKQPVARPDLQYDTMATSVTNNGAHLWDEQRETLYVRRQPQNVVRFQNTGTEWVVTEDVFGDDDIGRMYLSASGNEIITRNGSILAVYAADTLEKLSEVDIVYIGNQGNFFSPGDKFDRLYFPITFSPGDAFAKLFSPYGTYLGNATADSGATTTYFHVSGNKDIVFGGPRSGDWYRYDASDGSSIEQSSPVDFDLRLAYPSMTGKYVEMNFNAEGEGFSIFDANLDFVGRLPETVPLDFGIAFRKGGALFDEDNDTMIVSYTNSTNGQTPGTIARYEMYDLTSATNDPFVAMDAVEVAGEYNTNAGRNDALDVFFASEDGQTFFRIGRRVTIHANPFLQ